MTGTRNRIRPPGSLQERLLKMAGLARQQAQNLPAGERRDQLLKKAELGERSAAIDEWLTSPGAPPPE